MKVQIVVPVTLCVSLALLGITKVRKTEVEKESKRNRFQLTKLRVTYDVLREYENDKVEMQQQVDKLEIFKKTLENNANTLKSKAEKAKVDVDACQGLKTSAKDEAGNVESNFNNLKDLTQKEIDNLNAEVKTLREKLAARSQICQFVKQDSQAASKLCNNEGGVNTNKKEEAKAAEPIKEEAKAAEPKKEEAKAAEPKKEEAKAAEPKKEEAKAAEPKKEEAKAAEPKKEEAKAAEPKKEEAKAAEPKKEEAKAAEPKKEEAKAAEPKKEEAKAEAPKKT